MRPTVTYPDKVTTLTEMGFIIGERDPRLNRDFPGNFMVAEMYEEKDVPTHDSSYGPWCIVGDDRTALVNEAYDFWVSL